MHNITPAIFPKAVKPDIFGSRNSAVKQVNHFGPMKKIALGLLIKNKIFSYASSLHTRREYD
jgi:hypothetical protein